MDAVVLASGRRAQVRAVEALAGELVVLRSLYERRRDARGEVHEHFAGFGLLRDEGRIESLADGAFAERSGV